jgi:hypothetical protein
MDEAIASGISLRNELAQHHKVLSPSDFGFHNAIKSDTGKIYFFGF